MEECEALCSRVGIIAAGRLQCLGGAQHLKSKFGGGYTIEISVGELHAAALPAAFGALFPGAQLSEHHVGKYRYALPQSSASLAHIFETMEAHKARLGVVNYAASQVDLLWLHLPWPCVLCQLRRVAGRLTMATPTVAMRTMSTTPRRR